MSKKNFLLVNPWVYDFALYDLWMRPLGLLRLAGILKNYGNVFLVDCLDRGDPLVNAREDDYGCGKFFKVEVDKPPALQEIRRPYFRYGIPEANFKERVSNIPIPDIVFITTGMTYWYPGVVKTIEVIKSMFPPALIVLGGVYATLLPQHARSLPGVDEVFTGRDERELALFLSRLVGEKVEVPPSPLPDLSLRQRKDSWVIETSRGCPFSCSYCASHLFSPSLVFRKKEEIIQELEYMGEEGVRHVALYDEAFLFSYREHALPLLEEIVKRNLSFTFHTPNGLHARFLSLEVAEQLKEANFLTLRLSLETAEENLQKETGGKVKNEELEVALHNLVRAGYAHREIGVYLMLGLPDASREDLKQSVLYVHSLGAKVFLANFSPIPGTPDWLKLKQRGVVREDMDPLWHNNTVFPVKLGWEEGRIKEIRLWVKELNRALDN
ncbi:MAG: radical SAM protein [Caldiserica bacterium]|nr:radical SAM protein [Caldisericota bacterium]